MKVRVESRLAAASMLSWLTLDPSARVVVQLQHSSTTEALMHRMFPLCTQCFTQHRTYSNVFPRPAESCRCCLPYCVQALYDNNNFAAAANIFLYGKNNFRNETAGIYRKMYDATVRNYTGERWYLTYANFYKSDTYMNDWFA